MMRIVQSLMLLDFLVETWFAHVDDATLLVVSLAAALDWNKKKLQYQQSSFLRNYYYCCLIVVSK